MLTINVPSTTKATAANRQSRASDQPIANTITRKIGVTMSANRPSTVNAGPSSRAAALATANSESWCATLSRPVANVIVRPAMSKAALTATPPSKTRCTPCSS